MNTSTKVISTERLELIPLTQTQLELGMVELSKLEDEVGMVIARGFVTEVVWRAIRMKVEKMRRSDPSTHAWFTYWLIVIKEKKAGAGMLGFKGYPNEEGSTEIGYGIDPEFQNRGYMTEAVQALIGWAFSHSFCREITAIEVRNPASRRLLEKLGAIQIENNEKFTSWKIQKPLE